ncbi:MAG: SEC-C metal-binding domain-containing protein [Pseudomonadota bacterium]
MSNPNFLETEWFDKLRTTSRCRVEVRDAAGWFKARGLEEYDTLIKRLIEAGEDEPLGILLNICFVNGVKVDPELLAETLKVVEPLTDLAPPYRYQDETAIGPLLQVAQSEAISWQRQAYAARLAAELTLRHGCDPNPVRRVLNKLKTKLYAFDADLIVQESLVLLEKEGEDLSGFPLETQRDALSSLPEERPPVVIGGTFSVRRPLPKLGRNAPCHCGSGKKYKKCCYEKDQDLLRDASPYEGLTMTQVRSTPGLVDDAEIINNMRAYELKKLEASTLGSRQLLAAYERCDVFGLRQKALEMLLELKGRTPAGDFDFGHMEDLLDSALDADDLDLAARIRDHIPEAQVIDPEGVRFRFEVLESREKFALMEDRCRRAIVNAVDPETFNDPLIDLSYNLEKAFPALALVFSRAAIAGNHGSLFDREALLDVVRNARSGLDLDPWSDPVEELFYRSEEEMFSGHVEKAKDKEIDNLRLKVAEARRAAAEKEGEIRKRESELSGLIKRLEHMERPGTEKQAASALISETSPEEKATIQRLRQQIEGLKGEVKSQQHERRVLREHLKKAQLRASSEEDRRSPQLGPMGADSQPDQTISEHSRPKKVLIPEFTPAFCRSCEDAPAPIVAKALRAAAGFGANDVQILRQTKSIKRIPDLFRIRVDLRYRLMVRPREDGRLDVLELLSRADLETWIKQHAP